MEETRVRGLLIRLRTPASSTELTSGGRPLNMAMVFRMAMLKPSSPTASTR
jgi:hypothetical protein